jgi:hypothetical protein
MSCINAFRICLQQLRKLPNEEKEAVGPHPIPL